MSDQSALSSGGRGRGRPSIGPSIPVRLSEEDKAFAEELGDGVAAAGVRIAIKAARILGKEATIRLSGDAGEIETKRGRGRPQIGKPLPVRLHPSEQETADLLGATKDGKVVTAMGVRRALQACRRLGKESTKRLLD